MAADKAKPTFDEIATTQDGRDITRGYVDGLPLLPPSDSVLQSRGGDYKIYEELLRDYQIGPVFQQRRLAVTSLEWHVVPGGKKRQDKAAADFLREQLQQINFDAVSDKMLYGVFYGYAVGEPMWGRDGRFVTLDNIKVRKQRRFGFAPDGSLRMETMRHPLGEAVPDRKFWVFATGADNDDEPYGLGLAHWLFWPELFKRNGIKFWMIFLEKFGMPTAKGTYTGTPDPAEKQKLLDALRAIQSDSAITIPEGMAIELIEAARQGTADYTALHDRMNSAIAKAILGQTASTEGTPGKLGNEELQADVRADIIKADADLVCYSFNTQIARWLTEWNFPNAAAPEVWRITEEPEDTAKLSERDLRVHQMGYKPNLQYVKEHYGEGFEPVQNAPGAPVPAADFAEGAAADTPGKMVGQLDDATMPAMDDWLNTIRTLVDEADSLEAIRDGLVALYPDMPPDQFADAMAQALIAADLAGRYEVMEQANGG